MSSFPADHRVLSRAQLQSLLQVEFTRAKRYSFPLSVCVGRVDGLAELQGKFGPSIKHQILDTIVQRLLEATRTSDAIGLAGSQWTVLLPHTDESGARTISERMCSDLLEYRLRADGQEHPIDVHCGVAAADPSGLFADAVLRNAEQALERASQSGLAVACFGLDAPPAPAAESD